jgi:putative DNA primase/helicase
MLILAVSAGFTGPLLKRAKQQETGGAGIHLIGDSSQGKTTALQVAGSIWGPPRFVRS